MHVYKLTLRDLSSIPGEGDQYKGLFECVKAAKMAAQAGRSLKLEWVMGRGIGLNIKSSLFTSGLYTNMQFSIVRTPVHSLSTVLAVAKAQTNGR